MRTSLLRILVVAILWTAAFALPVFAQEHTDDDGHDHSGACKSSDAIGQTMAGRTITSGFGQRVPPPTTVGGRTGSSFHEGIDLAATDSVGALYGGTVEIGRQAGGGGYGNFVKVTNGNLQIMYAHANSISVQSGQQITPGTVIGSWAGTQSGNTQGGHVHVEYKLQTAPNVWASVNPIIVDQMIAEGRSFDDPADIQKAISDTATNCNVDPSALDPRSTDRPLGPTYQDLMCDPNIFARVSDQVKASVAMRNDTMQNAMPQITPPLSQVANTPCLSQELQRISNQLAYMPTRYTTGVLGGASGALGPISGIVNKIFKSQIEDLNKAVSKYTNFSGLLNLQGITSAALGGLLNGLGLGNSEFASELCGMMVDMLLKYAQCELQPQLPNLFQFPTLNLPFTGCAGAALRSTLYQTANMKSLDSVAQRPGSIPGGTVRIVPSYTKVTH